MASHLNVECIPNCCCCCGWLDLAEVKEEPQRLLMFLFIYFFQSAVVTSSAGAVRLCVTDPQPRRDVFIGVGGWCWVGISLACDQVRRDDITR